MSSIREMIDQKKLFREYRARKDALASPYREVLGAVERYLMCFASSNAEDLQSLLDDLIDLFESSAASKTPIPELVGDDPVEFIEGFIRNYPQAVWIAKERDRMIQTIEGVSKERYS